MGVSDIVGAKVKVNKNIGVIKSVSVDPWGDIYGQLVNENGKQKVFIAEDLSNVIVLGGEHDYD